ncbi:MAG: DMT family transporter [Candidatus Acidiferrales bacterium]
MSGDSSPPSPPPGKLALAFWLFLMLALWSFNYIAGKIALRHLDPFTLVSFRFILAALLMLPIYLAQPKRTPFRARDIWPLAYLGFFGVLLNQGLFTVGLNYTSSGHAAVVVALGPVVILFLAVALHLEHLTPGKLFGTALCFAGVLLLEHDHGSFSNSPFLWGDIISIGGTIGYAAYVVLGKRVARTYDSIFMTTFTCVAAALYLSPLAIRQAIHLDWRAVGLAGWAALFYMAAGSSVAAYLILYWALRHTTATRIGVVSYFQPVFVIVLSAVLLAEQPTRNLLGGTALVLIGVFFAERAPA